MRFDQSVRGLTVDAPVEFLGINIGKVVSVNLDYDEKTQGFPVVVGAVVYPQRLGNAYNKLEALAKARGENPDLSQMMGRLVDHGLRAQARSGNLLTGQLYVALDFLPKSPKVVFDPNAKPLMIPTVPGSFDKLQEQLAEIVDKIDKIPFESIGKNLDQTLASLNATIQQVNGKTLPEFKNTLKGVQKTMGTANDALSSDSPLQQNLGSTLQELQRAARSLRVLTDYLSGHPEALIRGRRADAPPTTDATPPPATEPQTGSKP
jgi:paraquat-inducible protein B